MVDEKVVDERPTDHKLFHVDVYRAIKHQTLANLRSIFLKRRLNFKKFGSNNLRTFEEIRKNPGVHGGDAIIQSQRLHSYKQ